MTEQHFEWSRAEERALARYVQPEDLPEEFQLPKYINRLDLLQAEGPRGVAAQLYSVISKQGIQYDLAPFNPRAGVTQFIRKPAAIFDKKRGTCLDLAVLFATMCLVNDLLPLLVVVEGHAFIGLSFTRARQDGRKPPKPFAWDKGKLVELSVLQELAGTEYLFIECTGSGQSQALSPTFPEGRGRDGNGRMSFERACEAGREQLLQQARAADEMGTSNQRTFLYALDIHDLQVNHGFEPIKDEAPDSVLINEVTRQINTNGGTYLEDSVNTGGGDFVGRDQTNINAAGQVIQAKIVYLGGVTEEHDRRNRRIMLDKVQTFWVEGVLEQSLHGVALLELGMEYKPDRVQYPWQTVLQRSAVHHSPQPLPPGAKMIEVFDEEGGELLILGAPGSGKTTMLLDLARDLIARAEQDEGLPIPVVFNLSSWAEKSPPLADWLMEELSLRYDVPKKICRAWIEKDQVLPLLDGLDEVQLEEREACVEAINDFRKEHLTHLAVCSRNAEYEALCSQLRLQNTVVLQPLTREQIEVYLQSAGEPLASVRALLQRDATLQELAESPLILSIMVIAYRGLDLSRVPALNSAEKQREHLFNTYIQRMFERRGSDKHYTPSQVIHWLAWLARRMVEHSQTTFYLERMQPDWLPGNSLRVYGIATKFIFWLFVGLVCGLFVGAGGGLVSGLFGSRFIGLFGGLFGGLFVGPFIGLFGGLAHGLDKKIKVVKTPHGSRRGLVSGLLVGLVIGLVSGLVFGLTSGLVVGLVIGLVSGPVSGLVVGVIVGSVVGVDSIKKIEAVETLRWSWRDALSALVVGPVIGLIFGSVVGPVVGLGVGLGIGLIRGLVGGLVFGLSSGLISGVVFGLVSGLKADGEMETKTIPNQGIRRSTRNAVLSGMFGGLVFGPLGGLIFGLMFGLVFGLSDRLLDGLVFGLFGGLMLGPVIGLVIGLRFGGGACMQHAALRLILHHNGSIPLNYIRFLDYCAERIFLRKVGGGYIFVHRLLMEHFAVGLPAAQDPPVSPSG